MKRILSIFNSKFETLHVKSVRLIEQIPENKLYWQPHKKNTLFPINSCGEYLLRSAGKVEQTCGGITTKLWDDPFEWTLPEQLSTNDLILQYLNEVEVTRLNCFAYFQTDEDLRREIPAPIRFLSLFEILTDTLVSAENYFGRAQAIFNLFADE